MQQIMQQMQRRGLFGQQQAGAQRFNPNINGLYGGRMPQIQYSQPVQQMARPMFQPPAPPQAAGSMPGAGQGAPMPLPPGISQDTSQTAGFQQQFPGFFSGPDPAFAFGGGS
jgi:hypothetical protein